MSKYLKSKNLINLINPIIDETELKNDSADMYYHLDLFDCTSSYYFYKDAFNEYELEKILRIGDKLSIFQASLSGDRFDKSVRESKISWIPINKETLWIYQKITSCIKNANESYFEYDLTKIEKLQFTRYYGDDNSFYAAHTDSNYGFVPDDRKLTFVLQLSDPDEYEGGELLLHTGKDPISIEKQKGLMVLFPSNILHECTPVTSGNRNTLVGWVHGPKFR